MIHCIKKLSVAHEVFPYPTVSDRHLYNYSLIKQNNNFFEHKTLVKP